jgi:glycosyltransferase involved in cell wall biosynthesis
VDFPLKRNRLSRRKYIKNVDAIIAISENIKKILVQGGVPAGLIEVIPSGIDFTPYEQARCSDYLRREFSFAADDYLVGIVAQLEDHKGHKYLIQASRILKEQAPRIKVIVVGSGSLQMELDRQAHDLRVDDVVYFLGFRKDVPQILSSLDLFVLSSHLEGLGSSIMDAMACRLPVVATMAGGIPEIVRHNETGLLVPPKDPSALADTILRLYRDRTLGRQLGENGYQVVHGNFSAEAMTEKTIALYERLARPKGLRLS